MNWTSFMFSLVTILLTLIILGVSSLLKIKFRAKAKKIHFHHAYWGGVIIIALALMPIIFKHSEFFMALAIALIISDILHHLIFKIPWE